MAVQPLTTPDELTTRLLGPRDAPEAWRFLSRCGVRDVFVASHVWRGALEQRLSDGLPEFHGAFAGDRLRALLFLGSGGLALPAGGEARDAAALGPVLARRAGTLRALLGERANVGALWPYAQAAGVWSRLDVIEKFMTADADTLDPEARESELRAARWAQRPPSVSSCARTTPRPAAPTSAAASATPARPAPWSSGTRRRGPAAAAEPALPAYDAS